MKSAILKYYCDSISGPFLDIAVSFDGTWMTRGHRSHVGAAFVIDSETGFVLDFEVLCYFCSSCNKMMKSKNPAEFAIWKDTKHNKCSKNYNGKSGDMEAECARRIWTRSTQLGLRYTTFISDGDSSAYNAVTNINDGRGPYDVPVSKEECINHVSKRLGTRLRNLKKDLREPTKTKTGKTVMRSKL